MEKKKILIWFRNDLRLHDQETISKAAAKGDVFPVYCFDPRMFRITELGFPKTGSYRAQFLLEAVANLRTNLQAIGSNLLVRVGHPEEVIPALVQELNCTDVYASKEVTAEELAIEEALETKLWKLKVNLEMFWQSTLFNIEDLPFPVPAMPEIFTEFRKQLEKHVWVRECLPTPTQLNAVPYEAGELPTLTALGLEPMQVDVRAAIRLKGGETAAKERLHQYIWESDQLKEYKETRNGLLGADYSSKFSAWLALGCLSPRKIFEQVKRYEKERISNASTYWLIFELIWRDFFRFMAKKHKNKLFSPEGFKKKAPDMHNDIAKFEAWKSAKTGIPFIDANMRELNLSGFMSNRGRQNVASLLVKDLQVNWLWGAAYFESMLIDYDVCSNWGNWCYVAGVGNDPREDRYFNILSQARKYDAQGEYVRHWIPELAAIQGFKIHHPALLTENESLELGIRLGTDYPEALVSIEKWVY